MAMRSATAKPPRQRALLTFVCAFTAPLPRNSDFLRFLAVAVLAAGGEGGDRGDGDNVEGFGTVIAVLQFGHGAVMPIWAGVAERCCPHVGHSNLSSIRRVDNLRCSRE